MISRYEEPTYKDIMVEDIRKLYAEVNQLLNQKFLLITSSLALYATAIAWIIQQKKIISVSLTTSLIFCILSVIIYANKLLTKSISLISEYMIVCDLTLWEKYLQKYAEKYQGTDFRVWLQFQAQWGVYYLLGVVTYFLPVLSIMQGEELSTDNIWFLIGHNIAYFFYISFYYWCYDKLSEQEYDNRCYKNWKVIINGVDEKGEDLAPKCKLLLIYFGMFLFSLIISITGCIFNYILERKTELIFSMIFVSILWAILFKIIINLYYRNSIYQDF